MKNLQDIIKDREIVKLENDEFANLTYEKWRVGHPIFADQIETLLENGFMCSTGYEGEFFVQRQLNPSPTQIMDNKKFWRGLDVLLQDNRPVNEGV